MFSNDLYFVLIIPPSKKKKPNMFQHFKYKNLDIFLLISSYTDSHCPNTNIYTNKCTHFATVCTDTF